MSSIFDLSERMLSPPSSPVTGSSDSDHSHPMGDQRALEKLALELSMLDLTNSANADGLSHNSADLAAALMNIQQHQQQQLSPAEGLVAGSTLNAFTSMLGFSPVSGVHFDDRSKKSQNMTECVPVPSSEHVAEIVGRQGKFEFIVFKARNLQATDAGGLKRNVQAELRRQTIQHFAPASYMLLSLNTHTNSNCALLVSLSLDFAFFLAHFSMFLGSILQLAVGVASKMFFFVLHIFISYVLRLGLIHVKRIARNSVAQVSDEWKCLLTNVQKLIA